jgi:hypothetical protein
MLQIPSLSFVKKILCNHFAATRTLDELETIKCFLSNKSEVVHDPLWSILPNFQQLQLCAYFHYHKVDRENIISLKDPSNNDSTVKLLILVKGSGELVCGDQTLPIDARNGLNLCIGAIPIPSCLRKLLKISSNENQYHSSNKLERFMQNIHKLNAAISLGREQPFLVVHKGSHYIYLSYLDCQLFMERLIEKQISMRVLCSLGFDSTRKKTFDFLTFPKDEPIIIQGKRCNKIILTIRGKFQLEVNLARSNDDTKKQETTKACHSANNRLKISIVGPMAFLGFIPYFTRQVDVQPLSVVASTKVRVLILDANKFAEHIKSNSTIYESFQDIAKRQIAWLHEKRIQYEEEIRMKKKEAKVNYNNILEFPNSSIEDLEQIVATKTRKKPKLNKHKFIKEFRRLVGGDELSEEEEEYEDLFLRFDFKDECMRELKMILEEEPNLANEKNTDLLPFPSIVRSHKMHGKTLPIVNQSDGFLNPFQTAV